MLRKSVLLLGLAACAGWLSPSSAFSQPKSATDEQIQTAIRQAVAHLKHAGATAQGGGPGALVTMALLKSGQPADSPEITGESAGFRRFRVCGPGVDVIE